MSKWRDAGFPDKLHLADPIEILTALWEALSERVAFTYSTIPADRLDLFRSAIPGKLDSTQRFGYSEQYFEQTLNRMIGNALYANPSLFIRPEKMNLSDLNFEQKISYIKNGNFNDYADDYYLTNAYIENLIGEKRISLQEHLSPRFSAAWALQQYHILNKMTLIRKSISYGRILSGRGIFDNGGELIVGTTDYPGYNMSSSFYDYAAGMGFSENIRSIFNPDRCKITIQTIATNYTFGTRYGPLIFDSQYTDSYGNTMTFDAQGYGVRFMEYTTHLWNQVSDPGDIYILPAGRPNWPSFPQSHGEKIHYRGFVIAQIVETRDLRGYLEYLD